MADITIHVPEDQQAGVYANFLSVWHTGHEFTLDFSISQPHPNSEAPLDLNVVSRVRIPTTLIFNVLRVLNENMTTYEERFGPLRDLEPPESGADTVEEK